jgi:outer membrane protein assembly factor BamB
MKTSELIFVGIKGAVVALNRATGQQVWATNLKGIDLVNVIVENGVVLAACHGEVFCLDPLTGNGIWHNPLRGFGIGLATMATEQNPGNAAPLLAEKLRRDQQAAADAAIQP